jgi:hypothetical protein
MDFLRQIVADIKPQRHMPIFTGFELLLTETKTLDLMQILGSKPRRHAGYGLSGYRLGGAVASIEIGCVEFPQSNAQLMCRWSKLPGHTIVDIGQELYRHLTI